MAKAFGVVAKVAQAAAIQHVRGEIRARGPEFLQAPLSIGGPADGRAARWVITRHGFLLRPTETPTSLTRGS